MTYNFLVHGIAVLDAGGQYCHLLARRVREAGVQSHVLPIDTTADQLAGVSGIIISGGPRSVTEAGSPRIDPSILSMGVPILGICYGHQLLAATMPGGVVKPSYSREYGLASTLHWCVRCMVRRRSAMARHRCAGLQPRCSLCRVSRSRARCG